MAEQFRNKPMFKRKLWMTTDDKNVPMDWYFIIGHGILIRL